MPLPSFRCPECGKVSYNPNDIEHEYCGWCHRGPAERAMRQDVKEEIRKIRMDVEITGDTHTLILSAPGIEPSRHEFKSREEMKAAIDRGLEALKGDPNVKGFTISEMGEQFLGGLKT